MLHDVVQIEQECWKGLSEFLVPPPVSLRDIPAVVNADSSKTTLYLVEVFDFLNTMMTETVAASDKLDKFLCWNFLHVSELKELYNQLCVSFIKVGLSFQSE